MKVMVLVGTRPEALKMAPVIIELQKRPEVSTYVVISGQQSEMVEQALRIFNISQTIMLSQAADRSIPSNTIATILEQLHSLNNKIKFDCIFVHGDTATTLAGALYGYYAGIKIYHVEAGLRTGDMYQPWPEEGNRRMVGMLAHKHFAPTESAKQNLLNEGVFEKNICMTGNTIVDALEYVKENYLSENLQNTEVIRYVKNIQSGSKIILVTAHRRENFGEPIKQICDAIIELSSHFENLKFIFPVHPNPKVRCIIKNKLSDIENVKLVEPLDYIELLYILNRSYCVLTDSGGIQEEAPSFGKPIFVLRDTTERPEILDAGIGILTGTDTKNIVQAVTTIIGDDAMYETMSMTINPFGTGEAAKQIIGDIFDEQKI